jgi:NAD(P)-dependent dehydrogenase (short-subunit alcohol dehydrogenase family)
MSDPLFDIQDRSIVIVGAASGLGRCISHALLARKARLLLADIAAAPLARLEQDLGPSVATMAVDITSEEQVEHLMEQAKARCGRLDGVVNSAGLLHIAPALTLEPARFRRTLDVNVTGAFLLSRAAARVMGREGGRIVHLASVSSQVVNVNYAAYATSKAALSQLVRVLAREWAPVGITINAIGPAMTETSMTEGYLSQPDFHRQALAAIPMGRLGAPEDLLGQLIVLLAPAGAFITGQTIYVDGGRTLV